MTQTSPRRATRPDVRTRTLDAAGRLLHRHGPSGVTTRGVAEAADIQAPAIYRLFGDKEGLLEAVAQHELARYVRSKAVARETDDPVADLRAAWDRHIRFGLTNPALFALLTDPDRAAGSPAAEAGLQVLRRRVHRVAQAGRLQVAEARAVELIHAAGTGAIQTLLAVPAAHRDLAVADMLYDAVLAVLVTDAPPAAPVTAADPVRSASITLRSAELPDLTAGERRLLGEWLDRVTGSAPGPAASH